MKIQYGWTADMGTPPELGMPLVVSGDPDLPTLTGVVLDHNETVDGVILDISIADGQLGSEAFQIWVMEEGEIAIMVDNRTT